MKKGISILGSTGSIGKHTLELVDQFPAQFRVVALSAGQNEALLRKQITRYRPAFASIGQPDRLKALQADFPDVEFGSGTQGLQLCASAPEAEVVVVGIVGFAAIHPTLTTIKCGKTLALANKEVLVAAGTLLQDELSTSQTLCIPVDSEHSALFQLLEKRDRSQIASLVLTASGGPLWNQPEVPLDKVTPQMATSHPNWNMGAKISVDSATMMNKGLELIEAHFLFDVPSNQIEVWVHPQSIVHGAVWLKDNSNLAQLSRPNMKLSISYALAYPDRLPNAVEKLSMKEMAKLEFYEPDNERFPCLNIAREALDAGQSHLITLNAGNEVAVNAFLQGRIRFSEIAPFLEKLLERHSAHPVHSIEDVFGIDEQARAQAISSLQ